MCQAFRLSIFHGNIPDIPLPLEKLGYTKLNVAIVRSVLFQILRFLKSYIQQQNILINEVSVLASICKE